MPDIYKNTKKKDKYNVTDVGTGSYSANYPNIPKLDTPSVTYGSQYPTYNEPSRVSSIIKPSGTGVYGEKYNVTDAGAGLYGAHYPNLPKLEPPSVTYGSQYPVYGEFGKTSPVVKPSEGAAYGEKYNVTDAGTGSVMTYEEYNNKKSGAQPGGNSAPTSAEDLRDRAYEISKDSRDAAYKSAELQREDTYRKAQEEKQRAVVDARTAYEQNKAVYGTSAEKLASMGLTGSGYGEYINSKAQANERLQAQRANAEATSAMRYADYIEQQTKLAADEADRKARFEADTIYNDFVSSDKLAEEQRKSDYIYQNGTLTEQYDQLVKDGVLTEETAKADRIKKQTDTYNEYSKLLRDSALGGTETYIDTSEIDKALEREFITQEQYDQLKKQYNSSLNIDINYFGDSIPGGTRTMTRSQAALTIANAIDSGWLELGNINAIIASYVANYSDIFIEDDYSFEKKVGIYDFIKKLSSSKDYIGQMKNKFQYQGETQPGNPRKNQYTDIIANTKQSNDKQANSSNNSELHSGTNTRRR